MNDGSRILYLCGGTQSSGSTLVSACFLQRSDTDGVLDADNDILTPLSPGLGNPFVWCKTTISCFRLSELLTHFEDEGWEVRPLLVVRDVRRVWASLAKKPYGRNGITAEDPPLRMRLRRFKEDWELFRRLNWPTIRYEKLVAEPEKELRQACMKLNLPWDEAMLTWPKSPEDIASTRHGNKTLRATWGKSLGQTIRPCSEKFEPGVIAAADLDWLESEFYEFNLQNNYSLKVDAARSSCGRQKRAVPSFEVTRRYKWEIRRKPIRWLLSSLGCRGEWQGLKEYQPYSVAS